MTSRPNCSQDRNKQRCNCTYEPCSRKGICCECISFHWAAREMPACFFSDEDERTFDRSVARFVESWNRDTGRR